MKKILLALLSLLAVTSVNADVLTTIKPLGLISSAITDGVTKTEVLVPVTASPHNYALKTSDVAKLRKSDLVVWIGEDIESFLTKSIANLDNDKVLSLSKIKNIQDYVHHNQSSSHSKDHHKHEDHHHDIDWHIWLSPKIAVIIAEEIANKLTKKMPNQADKIKKNLANFKANIEKTHKVISKQISKVKNKGYYTFHDAYGYFERNYGLHSLGSFTINPSIATGVKKIAEIKKEINEHNAVCLFVEPQFTPKVVDRLQRQTSVKVGKLDPLGEKIPLTAQGYTLYLQSLANSFTDCLE